jgi:hypothetical protein
MTDPARGQVLQREVRMFLIVLAEGVDDPTMAKWLAAGQDEPETGKAAWARDVLGLSRSECGELAREWSQQLDEGRTGMMGTQGIYVTLNGPRGPVQLALWDTTDHPIVQLVGVDIGRLRQAWKPDTKSAG